MTELLAENFVLVEFSDSEGQTYAIEALPTEGLMRLRYQPYEIAA